MLLTLAGCGKEAPPAEQPKAPPPPPRTTAADDRPVIVAFGDSLTAGFGVDAGLSFPDYLQKELDAAGYRYRVVNEGVSGDTSSGGVERIRTVLAGKPRIVILELGANDGLRGIPVAKTRANLDLIITELRKAGVKVLLAGITLPRNYGPDYIKEFDRIYPEIARKHRVPLLPFLLDGVALHPDLMQKDGLHPLAPGNRIVAGNVMKALRPLLERR
ncbi:MAG: arylesterase [Bryobacterales bacterium]|nr:arylesterase [Bryobacterales bacterium]